LVGGKTDPTRQFIGVLHQQGYGRLGWKGWRGAKYCGATFEHAIDSIAVAPRRYDVLTAPCCHPRGNRL